MAVLLFPGIPGNQGRAQSNAECMACHSDSSLSATKEGKDVSLFVDEGKFSKSIHAGVECVSCHVGFNPADLPHAKELKPVECGACHAEVEAVYAASNHGQALKSAQPGAPKCADCHGAHDIVPSADAASPTGKKHQAATCLKCHADSPDVRSKVGPSAGFIKSYEMSVHAKAVGEGNDMAATCADCHGSHEMRKGSDPAARTNVKNIAATCGSCHPAVEEEYRWSVHGKALISGISESPTCTGCHGEHSILSAHDPASPVAPGNVSSRVCSPCHASVRLANKYGLNSDRFATFQDSYHGLAGRSGSVEVANCASCHGVHDIKPSSDSTSRISSKNLVATCGTCHPGAGENFTKGRVHVIAADGDDDILYLVASTYIVLIVLTIGFMLLHNIADFVRKSRRQLAERRGEIPYHHHTSRRLYLRMSLNERLQHGSLVISFALLVITGFALRYPDAWWVAWVRNISPLMFEIRGIVHRSAAVVMVLVSLYHLYYIFAVPRGKQLIRDLLPVWQDARDAFGIMRYNLGLSPEKPLLGRFSYIEKAEYWALIWGTIVMSITGVILWFDNTFLNLLTKLWWDVARTVHYYEAWLATLAIVVWHFYFVIFNPDSYPINLAFWKGTMTEEEMAEEHPLELKEIQAREAAEKRADRELG